MILILFEQLGLPCDINLTEVFAPTSINPDSLFTGEGLDPFLIPDQITEDTKCMIYKKYNFFYVDTPFLPLCPFTGIVSNSKEIK